MDRKDLKRFDFKQNTLIWIQTYARITGPQIERFK